ncbi:hypothetical protein [Actinokineospora cianjurensis]|uniref:Vegetative cell wall protein gp1 n=1 Tax=Actinokineospora cianjurensis TaxID=585224 RepID=A0A421B2V0_9PSEU|nr:hypothetical protein [Actinokineospora cianjurensis]RLK58709.1 hypothetical protein CLV68_3184 [Actinokineospora cianjurensis]
MNPFLSALGGKLAERWVSALLLPGALFVAAVVCAVRLGHRDAWDLARVVTELTTAFPRVPVALAAVGLVLGAAAAAFVAQGTGRLIETVWTSRWSGPAAVLARPVVALRVRAATRTARRAGVEPVPAYLPQRATWISDRFRLLEVRIAAQYHGVRLGLLWPRLWLLLPEQVRAPVQLVETQFRAAVTLTGWGLLYLVLGVWWYPAALAGACAALIGWRRTRFTTNAIATLMEATVDTHLDLLTTALGYPSGGLDGETAPLINDRFDKGS